ncbi:hypothetical protein JW899_01065 [Candidatus Uhrbacteria bacterium]|nr:hypothetical protein [Candidatus Uhrbacteria bacterium]
MFDRKRTDRRDSIRYRDEDRANGPDDRRFDWHEPKTDWADEAIVMALCMVIMGIAALAIYLIVPLFAD